MMTFLLYTILQSVEEAECRRAYDYAAEVYMSSFDRTKPADEVKCCSLSLMNLLKLLLLYNLY